MIYQFAEFTLDTAQNKLFKHDEVVKLGDKSFKLISLLIQQSPQTVSKQQVMQEVWKDRVVTESTLYKTISRIRQELEGQGLTIESVFSEGYRISGAVKKIDTQTHLALTEKSVTEPVKANTLKTSYKWLWPIILTSLVLIASLFFAFGTAQPTLRESMIEMRQAMSITKKSFISQINRRNELGEMLSQRFELDPKLSWERRFFQYHDQMNEAELFVFDQIRAYTDGPMLNNNQIIFDLLNNNPQIIEEIPLANDLRNHLAIWLNKYHKVFKNSKKMCLLYVGVEDGAPYPSAVDQQVIDWLGGNPVSK